MTHGDTLTPTALVHEAWSKLSTGIAQLKLRHVVLRQRRYLEAEEHTLAAYRVVNEQSAPPVSRLKSARKDLAEIYSALGQPEKAQEFRLVEGNTK